MHERSRQAGVFSQPRNHHRDKFQSLEFQLLRTGRALSSYLLQSLQQLEEQLIGWEILCAAGSF